MSYHGLGQASTTITDTRSVSVVSIQCALRARGVSIAADGRFGPNTRAGLIAQQAAYLPSVMGLLFQDAATGATSVQINRTFYEWLMGSTSCRSATASSAPSTPVPTSPTDEAPIETIDEPESAPWKTLVPIGGAAVFLGLGFYFLKRRRG